MERVVVRLGWGPVEEVMQVLSEIPLHRNKPRYGCQRLSTALEVGRGEVIARVEGAVVGHGQTELSSDQDVVGPEEHAVIGGEALGS